MKNIAILWDIQNVLPSQDNANLLIDGLVDYAKGLGNLSYSLVVGDWKINVADNIPYLLSEKGFELSYIPQLNSKGRKTKDSVDFILITKTTEMIFQYPHISTYILLAGDIDYRPLLHILKKHGKEIIIIYNNDTVSERLLEFVDDYMDYRDLIPDESDDYSETESVSEDFDKKRAFKLLSDSVSLMVKGKKTPTPGSIKVKMKMLDDTFSGNVIGFKNWLDFLNDANKNNVIEIRQEKDDLILCEKSSRTAKKKLPEIIEILLKTMEEISPKKDWVPFTSINNRLLDNNINIKNYKYSKFKKLALDAEKRGFIETRSRGLKWYARLKQD